MRIEEGSATIDVPEVFHGPGKKRAVFYNSDQVLNRDITVMFVRYAGIRRFLDGFGGSGIRGIRVALETSSEVTISENDTRSYESIVANSKMNRTDIRILNTDFFCAVSSGLYDFIDIDPYGSVVPFLDPAILKVRRNGYIGITATDLSSLTGSTPEKTRRRYEANIRNDVYRHEMGVRLLCAYVARRAAALDRAAFPVLSVWHGHYYRIFFRISNGTGRADSNLENVSIIRKGDIIDESYGTMEEGPVWTGRINDPEIVKDLARSGKYAGMFERMLNDNRLLFYDLTYVSSSLSMSIPPIDSVIGNIKEMGFTAGRTNFSWTGIKTDIPYRDFISLVSSCGKEGKGPGGEKNETKS